MYLLSQGVKEGLVARPGDWPGVHMVDALCEGKRLRGVWHDRTAETLMQVQSGERVQEVCREHGISQGTYYRWKSKYGGMDVSEARRLRELEAENRRLKSAVADLTLREQALKEALARKW